MGKHLKNTSSYHDEEAPSSREWDEKDDQIDFEFLKRVEDLTTAEPAQDDADPQPGVPDITVPSAPEEDGKKAAPGSREEPPAQTQTKTAVAVEEKTRPRPAGKKPAPAGSRKRRKKKNRFRTGLIVYLLVLLALIVGTLAVEWVMLDRSQKRYDAEAAEAERIEAENAQRIAHEKAVYQAPQKAFEAWLAGTDADYWTDLWYQNANVQRRHGSARRTGL